MTGTLALLGGQEHTAGCEVIDRRLLEEARTDRPVVTVVLAASTPRRRAFKINEALTYWHALGVDVRFAMHGGDNEIERALAALENPDLVVMTGGHPWLLHARLMGTAVQQRIVELWERGVPISGSSAGAIALCEWRQYLQPPHPLRLARSFGLVPGAAAAPHYDRYGLRHWVSQVSRRHPALQVLGLSDRTALIGGDGNFRVYGRGVVTVVRDRHAATFGAGDDVELATAALSLGHDRLETAPGDDGAIAPAPFGFVQRGVGRLDERLRRGGMTWQGGHADAGGDGQRGIVAGDALT